MCLPLQPQSPLSDSDLLDPSFSLALTMGDWWHFVCRWCTQVTLEFLTADCCWFLILSLHDPSEMKSMHSQLGLLLQAPVTPDL